MSLSVFVYLILAYSSSMQCGTGLIGSWVETFDWGKQNFIAPGVGFNPATGVYQTERKGFWYFSACFLCNQGSGCDVRMHYQGTPVAALGNRWDGNGNTRREEMLCQHLVISAVSHELCN